MFFVWLENSKPQSCRCKTPEPQSTKLVSLSLTLVDNTGKCNIHWKLSSLPLERIVIYFWDEGNSWNKHCFSYTHDLTLQHFIVTIFIQARETIETSVKIVGKLYLMSCASARLGDMDQYKQKCWQEIKISLPLKLITIVPLVKSDPGISIICLNE